MNNKTDINVKYVSPLKKICMTIGELPASYLETMSYYEMLVWFTEFLKNQVIPTLNNNAEAVQELQNLYEELRTYVNNYFDNLDVQDEINNKLEAMAESGQLTDIIAQYLGLAGMIAFDTVASMKLAENLVNGSKCTTLGYRSINDGGSALYKIRNITNDDIVDEKFIIAVADDNLIAELICDNVNLKQIGAYGNGTNDDSSYFKVALSYARAKKLEIYVPSGTYLLEPHVFQNIEDASGYTNLIIKGDGNNQSTLKLNNTTENDFFFDSNIKQIYSRIYFSDLNFIGNDNTANGFNLYSTGTDKQLRFTQCAFTLKNLIICSGTGNADLTRFTNCSINSYGDVLTLNNDQSVEHEFYGCGVGLYGGALIKHLKGGCVQFFGGEVEAHGTSGYTLDVSSETNTGVGNRGINFFGTRFEFHNGQRFINATGGKQIALTFTNCNLGTADVLGSGYYSTIYKNAVIKFNNCTLINNLKFYVYTEGTFLSDSSTGALLMFDGCTANTKISGFVTTSGNFSRVIAHNCNHVSVTGIKGCDDFDWNWLQRSEAPLSANVKFVPIKRTGEGYPSAGNGTEYSIPAGSYIKKIKIYRPASTSSTNPYQLHIGSHDEQTIYGETSSSAIFNDEIDIDVDYVGTTSDGIIRMWATGTATNISESGYAYIEYI